MSLCMRGLGLLCLVAVGCGDSKSKSAEADAGNVPDAGKDGGSEPVSRCVAPPKGKALTNKAILTAGPYEIGDAELMLVDSSRETPKTDMFEGAPDRTFETKVWFPADKDGALAEGGPFPLIVWSHGFSSTNLESEYASPHLASRGYIVAAPAFPLTNLYAPGGPRSTDFVNQPEDVSFIIDAMFAKSKDAADPLAKSVDTKRVALVGLSVGASTTLITTFHPTLYDKRVKAAVALASPGAYYGKKFFDESPAKVPLFAIHGTLDAILPFDPNATTLNANARGPFWAVTIAKGTHTAFTNYGAGLDQPETLGCSRISDTNAMQPNRDPVKNYEMLGGTKVGFILPAVPIPEKAVTCTTDPLPTSITGARQQELTTLLITAFLDMQLNADAEERNLACQYLEEGAAKENKEIELSVR